MDNIQQLLDSELAQTEKEIFAYPWEDRLAYAMWLSQTFHMVCHSTRLVALAGAYCDLAQSDLHARFVDHAKEERGHDKIALLDLKHLGFHIGQFPRLGASQAMYQVQYYWIQHMGPTSFFGYTLALEALAVRCGPTMHRRSAEAHGEKASLFLKLHSEDDIQHLAAARGHIEKLSGNDLKLAKENLILSCELYRGMIKESATWARDHQELVKAS